MATALATLVRRSPELVLAQDRAGWLALFADDGVVEDPVGSAPHARRPGAGLDCPLSRFYSTFIAGNRIEFDVHRDLAGGGGELLRDVTIRTRLSTGQDLRVPAYLLYQATATPAGLRIARLRAIWDVRANVRDTLLGGWRGPLTLCAMTARLLRNQGLRGSLGYSRGLVQGIFGRGPARLQELAASLREPAAAGVFAPGAEVELPVGAPRAGGAWLAAVDRGAELKFERPLAAGWLTAARFALRGAEASAGVAVAEFDPPTRKVRRLRFFTAPAE
jgi:hypothetical protein